MARFVHAVVLVLLAAVLASPQTKKAGAAKAPETKFKAIWEPVSFPKDIELKAIACTGPEICWVAGDKSTILFTSDGGSHWQAQLGGDPEATDEDLAEIFVVDGKHGWAMTERSRLLSTADGATWAALGKVPSTSRALTFLTPAAGLVADRGDSQSQSRLNRTVDGGKSWTRGEACSVETTVDGLARKLGCIARDIQFVSPAAGFMGGAAIFSMGTNLAAFSRTTDGGATWTHSVIPDTKHAIDSIHFWSEKDGLALLASGQTYWTADGGSTWTGSTNPPAWRSHYASGQGKIIVGVNESGKQAGYSFNGGRSFSSRPAGFPAEVRAVMFPDATHGYLVGQHGMIFRYRIVPADYNVPGIIAAAAP